MTDDQREALLRAAEHHARAELSRDSSGHDWWHIARVRALARSIAEAEGADLFICELAALLHDLADYKIAGDDATGQATVRAWLDAQGAEATATERVMEIIATMSFKGGAQPPVATLEARVVQDADRLDAIGAVGIARAFAFGGSRGRALHDPEQPPRGAMTVQEYRANTGSTINHFHEKLLLLKERMNTPYARRLAEARHAFMEQYLAQFAAEWAGER